MWVNGILTGRVLVLFIVIISSITPLQWYNVHAQYSDIQPVATDLVLVVNSTSPACIESPDNLYFDNLTSALTYLNSTSYTEAIVYVCPGTYMENGSEEQFLIHNTTIQGYDTHPLLNFSETIYDMEINGSNIVFKDIDIYTNGSNIDFYGEDINVSNMVININGAPGLVFYEATNVYVDNIDILGSSAISDTGIEAHNIENMVISNIYINNSYYGIYLEDTTNTTIYDIAIENNVDKGIIYEDVEPSPPHSYLEISNVEVAGADSADTGIYVTFTDQYTDVYIDDASITSYATGVYVDTSGSVDSIFLENIDVRDSMYGVVFETLNSSMHIRDSSFINTVYGVAAVSAEEDDESNITIDNIYVELGPYPFIEEYFGVYIILPYVRLYNVEVNGSSLSGSIGAYVVGYDAVFENITVYNCFDGVLYTPYAWIPVSIGSRAIKPPSTPPKLLSKGISRGINPSSLEVVSFTARNIEAYNNTELDVLVSPAYVIPGDYLIENIEAYNSYIGLVIIPAFIGGSHSVGVEQAIQVNVSNAVLYNNEYGFYLDYVFGIYVEDANASYNSIGILIEDCSNIYLSHVVAVYNSESDIVIEGSEDIYFEDLVVTTTLNQEVEVQTYGDIGFEYIDEDTMEDLLELMPWYWGLVLQFNITFGSPDSWVYIEYHYSDQELEKNNIDEKTLVMWHYDEDTGTWEPIEPVVRDTVNNYVAFNLSGELYGSPFILGGNPAIVGGEIVESSSSDLLSVVIPPLLISLAIIAIMIMLTYMFKKR